MNHTQSRLKGYIDLEEIVELRHKLHENPEIGFKEFITQKILLDRIQRLITPAKHQVTKLKDSTGFWVDVKGQDTSNRLSSKLSLAFRTELDALPLEENSNLEYKSKIPNCFHGCGHDGHMAILTAFLEFIIKIAHRLPSNLTLRFLYQPAEELEDGAPTMIRGNCLEDIDEIYALHNFPLFKLGEIGLVEGTILGSLLVFHINISRKDKLKGASPIVCGSLIVTEINKIVARDIDSKDLVTISVGEFNSGEKSSDDPDTAIISGTVRTINKCSRNIVKEKLESLLKNICDMYDINHEVEILAFDEVFNDSKLTNEVVKKAISNCRLKHVEENLPIMASEDFSDYLKEIPGVFFILGTGDNEHIEYNHNPEFKFNDLSIDNGIEMFIRILEIKIGLSLLD